MKNTLIMIAALIGICCGLSDVLGQKVRAETKSFYVRSDEYPGIQTVETTGFSIYNAKQEKVLEIDRTGEVRFLRNLTEASKAFWRATAGAYPCRDKK